MGRLNAFGERLRDLRKSRGLSQEDLAKTIGCNVASIMYWENCMKEPAISYVLRLCKHLEVDPNYLLCWEIYGPEGRNK